METIPHHQWSVHKEEDFPGGLSVTIVVSWVIFDVNVQSIKDK